MLVDQPTAEPTRKMWAVIIWGALLGAAQVALQILWPDHPFAETLNQFDVLLQAAVMALAGYMTREAA